VETEFTKLNADWNAEPNAPMPALRVEGTSLVITFFLNHQMHKQFSDWDRGELVFSNCSRYRLGATNDEGWDRGQCRFSSRAPAWGEFYELRGDLLLDRCPQDWVWVGHSGAMAARHFLFYFRDETFECDAEGWSFKALPASAADVERLNADSTRVTLKPKGRG